MWLARRAPGGAPNTRGCALSSGADGDGTVTAVDDEAAIRQLFTTWGEASRKKDIERLLTLITKDAVFLAPGQPPLRGREAARQLFTTIFSRFDLEQNFEIAELQLLGDWAFCWGTDSSVMRPVGGGEAIRARGMGLSLIRRGADGGWRFARGINNMMRETS